MKLGDSKKGGDPEQRPLRMTLNKIICHAEVLLLSISTLEFEKIIGRKKYMAYIYILTNEHNTVLYVGVTNDLVRRIYEHKQNMVEGFSKRYQLHKLVYYEQIQHIGQAIEREKQLKQWHRKWKNRLIETINKNWNDLYKEVCF